MIPLKSKTKDRRLWQTLAHGSARSQWGGGQTWFLVSAVNSELVVGKTCEKMPTLCLSITSTGSDPPSATGKKKNKKTKLERLLFPASLCLPRIDVSQHAAQQRFAQVMVLNRDWATVISNKKTSLILSGSWIRWSPSTSYSTIIQREGASWRLITQRYVYVFAWQKREEEWRTLRSYPHCLLSCVVSNLRRDAVAW